MSDFFSELLGEIAQVISDVIGFIWTIVDCVFG